MGIAINIKLIRNKAAGRSYAVRYHQLLKCSQCFNVPTQTDIQVDIKSCNLHFPHQTVVFMPS